MLIAATHQHQWGSYSMIIILLLTILLSGCTIEEARYFGYDPSAERAAIAQYNSKSRFAISELDISNGSIPESRPVRFAKHQWMNQTERDIDLHQ